MTRPVDPALVEALGHLLAVRHVGREEAATWETLRCELEYVGCSVPVVRRLQEAACVLRGLGMPVAGLSGSGVFLARSIDEWDDTIAEKRRRAVSALAELRAAKRIRARMLGQESMRAVEVGT